MSDGQSQALACRRRGIVICGVVAEVDGVDAMAVCAKSKKSWLEQFVKLPHGLPLKGCIRRVLTALKLVGFQNCFQAWLVSVNTIGKVTFLGIHGKTPRRSHD
mgnify:CR=1 FL=1